MAAGVDEPVIAGLLAFEYVIGHFTTRMTWVREPLMS